MQQNRLYVYAVIGIIAAAIFGLCVGLKIARPIVVETVDISALEGKVDALATCACDSGVQVQGVEYISVPYTETITLTTVVTDCRVTTTPPTDVHTSTTATSTPAPTTTPTPTSTPTSTTAPPTPTATSTTVPPTATASPTATPEATPKPKCNQGRGNGPEGCSPGQSDNTVRPGHPKSPNDEPPAKGKRK